MPKKIDPQLRARCVRLVRDHAQEYPTLTDGAHRFSPELLGELPRCQRRVKFDPVSTVEF
ncbi:hypothetical protein [Brachybacterium sp. UNK5269]|uniref:hypothetical protein n=1 Tax=Brachybacterium sp. UNK5269 TaxID=3408576 RepID=UPI003BAF31CF